MKLLVSLLIITSGIAVAPFANANQACLTSQSPVRHDVRSPVCNPAELEIELAFLHLTNIQKNSDLQREIIEIYGESMWEAVAKAHPYLRMADGALDSSTIEWLIEKVSTTYHSLTREVIIPFSQPNERILEATLQSIFGHAHKGHFGSKLVFVSEEMRTAFRDYLGNKSLFRNIFVEAFSGNPPYTDTPTLMRWSDLFYDSLMSNDRVFVGVPNRPEGYKPVIEIDGHGTTNGTAIADGAGNSIESAELITQLKEQGLLTDNTRIKLSACNAATYCSSSLFDWSAEQIRANFISGELQDIMSSGEATLLHTIRKEVSKQLPGHNSTIEGYLGTVYQLPERGVLHRDGTERYSNFVIIKANDNTLVKLNRKEMRVVLYPGSLNPQDFVHGIFDDGSLGAVGASGRLYARRNSIRTNAPISDIYKRLVTASVLPLPASGQSNRHWQHIGPRQRNSVGNEGDIYIYENPYTDETEYFQLKREGSYNQHYPTNQTSDSHWRFLATADYIMGSKPALLTGTIQLERWRDTTFGSYGYYSQTHAGGSIGDIFWLKKSGVYGALPARQQSNSEWEYVGPRQRGEAGRKGDIYQFNNSKTGLREYFQLKRAGQESSAFSQDQNSDGNWIFLGTEDSLAPQTM